MQKTWKFIGLVLFTLLVWSCDEDLVVVEPAIWKFENERVDLVLRSTNEIKVNSIGENNLIDISNNFPSWYYPNEKQVNIDLGGDSFLKLIIRNANSIDPFLSGYSYSAFPLSIMEDRNTYVIAHYINNGILQYATTRINEPSPIQSNVLQIKNVHENGFSARFNNLKLDKIDFIDDGRSNSGEFLTVNGTFIAIFD